MSAGDRSDSNYAGACVNPDASDYDCEGGNGDGTRLVSAALLALGALLYAPPRAGTGGLPIPAQGAVSVVHPLDDEFELMSKMALDASVAERQVQIAERAGEMIGVALDEALAAPLICTCGAGGRGALSQAASGP